MTTAELGTDAPGLITPTTGLFQPDDLAPYGPPTPRFGARLVPTGFFDQTLELGRQMYANHGALRLEGAPGTGKTTAAMALCKDLGAPVLSLHLASTTRGDEVIRTMLACLGEGTTGKGLDLRHRARLALLGQPVVVFVDEAHLLNKQSLQAIRWLFDQKGMRFMLLLTGVDFRRAWSLSPEFASRVARKVDFKPLAGKGLVAALKAHHPVLAATPNATLQRIDGKVCLGTWRKWEQVLYLALGYGATKDTGIDDRIADAAIAAIPAAIVPARRP